MATVDLDALFLDLEMLVAQAAAWAPHRLISEMQRLKEDYIHGGAVVKEPSFIGLSPDRGDRVEVIYSAPVEPEPVVTHDDEQDSDISKHEHGSGAAKPRRRRVAGQ